MVKKPKIDGQAKISNALNDDMMNLYQKSQQQQKHGKIRSKISQKG